MEESERNHIQRNLYELICNTRCTVALFSHLLGSGLLIQDEVDVIDSKATPSEKASYLYRIVQTKSNGYYHLVESLKASSQTGAVDILTVPARAKSKIELALKDQRSQGTTKRAKTTPSAGRFGVKSPTSLFTGRSDELDQLHHIFQESSQGQSRVTVITQIKLVSGLGGIGKTQLARQYVHEYGSYFDDNVIWMNAEREETLFESFRRLATDKLGISTRNANGEEKDITTVVGEVYKALEYCKVLLVLDNAEVGNHMRKFIPTPPPQDSISKLIPYILITSRDVNWDIDPLHIIRLREMKEEDAIEFVMKGLKITNPNEGTVNLIKSLVNKLHCFPLAIQQAISYIIMENTMGDYDIRNYLDEFEANEREFLDTKLTALENDYHKTTFATWKVTLAKISSEGKYGATAAHLLNCIAYMSAENIERSMLLALVPEKNEKELKMAINLLVRYSMLNAEQKQSILSVHRLVQHVIRIQLSSNGQEEEILEKILQLLQPEDGGKRLLMVHVDHAVSAWTHSKKYPSLVTGFSRLPRDIVKAMSDTQERLSEAFSFGTGENGMKILETSLSQNHEHILMLEYQLCCVLFFQGRSEQALERLGTLIEKHQQCEEVDYGRMLNCKELIARIYLSHKNSQKALDISLEILEERKKKVEWRNISTASTLHSVAMCYAQLGNCEEAVKYYKDSAEIYTAILGAENQQVAVMLHNMALVKGDTGDFIGAMEVLRGLYSRTLSVQFKFRVRHNLAYYLYRMREYEESLKICEETLSGRIENFGEDHQNTVSTLHLKGTILRSIGEKMDDAVEILLKAYTSRFEMFGENHQDTLVAKADLAMAWYIQDKSESSKESLFLIEETIRTLAKVLGEDNREVVLLMVDFTSVLEKKGNYKRCLGALEDVQKRLQETQGNAHYEVEYVSTAIERVGLKLTANTDNTDCGNGKLK